jgi:hypothetical protein
MKSLFESKTFWVNVLSGLATFLEGTQFTDVIPDHYEPYAAMVVFAVNIILRYLTVMPVQPLMGDKGPRGPMNVIALLVVPSLILAGCGKSAPVLVGESAVVTSRFIQEASNVVMTLREPQGPLSLEKTLQVQESLKKGNDGLKELIPILRAIDAAQKAGDPAQPQIEEAIRLVQNVGTSLNLSVQGVPVAEAAAKLLEIVNNARGALATVQATLDAMKNRQSGDLAPSIQELEKIVEPVLAN